MEGDIKADTGVKEIDPSVLVEGKDYDFKVITKDGTFTFRELLGEELDEIKRTIKGINNGKLDEDLLQKKMTSAMSVYPKITDIQQRTMKASSLIRIGLAINKSMELDDFLPK